jgi:rod shape determining protein RodA
VFAQRTVIKGGITFGSLRASPGDPRRNIDWVLLGGMLGIIAIGLPIIYSTTYKFLPSRAVPLDPYLYLQRQVVFIIVGALAMALVMSLEYQWWKERARFLYGGTVFGLLLVLGLGRTTGGATSAFDLGPISIQPSEFGKFATALFLAAYLSEDRAPTVTYSKFIGGLMLVGAPMFLVLIEPDLGSASVYIALVMGVMLVAGAQARHIVMITMMAVLSAVVGVVTGLVKPYQISRLVGFLNQNSNDKELQDLIQQVKQAKRAFGNGGLFGKGWLDGPLTNNRSIPVQWADFPVTALAEQFGMLGVAVLLSLYGVVLARIWRTAHLSKDMLGTYICAGVFSMLLWHVFENVGMSLGIMPVTGIPLPLVSYGGSSLVSFLMMLGMVQNVHMRRFR